MNKNRRQVICLLLLISALTIPVLADTGNQANDNISGNITATEMGNAATTGNVAVGNTAIAVTEIPNATETPIPEEEKMMVTNIAINLTVNIGINNTQVIDVTRDSDNKQNLRVRVKDLDTDDIIVVIVTPQGEAKSDIPPVQFTEVANKFTGRHVSFQYTKSNITDYTVDGRLIFKSIDLGFTSTKVNKVGSEIRISDDKNIVIIHDDDEGIMTERSSENIEAVYQAASDISLKLSGNGKRTDFSGNIRATLSNAHPDNPSEVIQSVSGNTIDVKVNSGLTRFIATTVKGDEFDDRVVEGITTNQIGTVINIDSIDSHDVTSFNVDTTINKVVTNTVSLSVNSGTPEGKIIALRVNKDILKDLNLRTIVDGDDIPKAKDFDDLFKNDKLSFLIVIGQDVEILISIPKFSEHQVVVTSEAPSVTSTGITTVAQTTTGTPIGTTIAETSTVAGTTTAPRTPGFTLGLILVVTTVLYILIKRKKI